ncbi:hypothetical protein CHGG_08359 [Chaetomium globosum CBS 148.51]|uniref:Uncharacterized protein n=1 Tax=Chaetomium globosum (strain ATCC 6205 / CBS 148.51 / DSM 1962 / NBRC 6347 / NRRL 1970) TaxID=306901 RepID=Q2GUJ5_CHAGB|nr:uncharacterized protein CHGG_08359 [Chaetomium globosum CBS 148.51]EAQ84345.1 hypothetical protein CHGG_08359 [Chaetomium globosum CBS 148.51]
MFQFRHRSSPASVAAAGPVAAQECKQEQQDKTPRRKSSQQAGVTGKGGEQRQRRKQQPILSLRHTPERQQQRGIGNLPLIQALPRAPDPCYDNVSLFYFIHRFVSPNREDGFPGHLSFLPSLYDSHSHGLLEVATLSVAQMAAYNKFGGEKFRVQSYENYSRAIRMLQNLIQSEEQATDDKVITSVLLLCMLNDICGEQAGGAREHAPGLYYLVEKRGLEQIATRRGAELLFLALIRLEAVLTLWQHVYSFIHDDDRYVDPGAIASAWGVFDPLLRALGMMSKTLVLRHQLLSGSVYLDAEEQLSVIQKCSETLDDFHRWDIEAADYWQSMFKRLGSPTALGQVASGTTHYDVETACTIILIRSARLILLMSMITHHYQQEQGGGVGRMLDEYLPFLEMDVTTVIDDILATVPYALGDVAPGGLPGTVPPRRGCRHSHCSLDSAGVILRVRDPRSERKGDGDFGTAQRRHRDSSCGSRGG